jgi:16S rRNA (cytosine967-C5)-methyltransferase
MSRFHSYINTAKNILQKYNGDEPFAGFLKKYFLANKKHGSKDRKQISHLCYCYFRLGKAAPPNPPQRGGLSELQLMEEKILTGLFLCSGEPNEILQEMRPEWNEKIMLPVKEKYSMLNVQWSIFNVFPWKEDLSEGIDHEKFCESFFMQPDLFIRIRPGHAEKVLLKLDELKVEYEFISPFCVRLPNSFNADKHFELDKEIVVQDYNSQRIREFLPVRPGRSDRVWDCCAGSGGKSIMAYDLNPKIDLIVSDIRESILRNLKARFKTAGIKNYKSFKVDLSGNKPEITNIKSEVIICDAPCTGSGTWSRTPEQLYLFNNQTIKQFSNLQKKIVSTVIPHLKEGGHFVYITCSVFKKENEELVKFIKEKFHLQQKQMELLIGYGEKADTMFMALFNS